MQTEADLIESLKAVRHEGKFLQANVLKEAIKAGPKSENFRELVTWIIYEIHVLRNTDEKVGKESDFNEFMLEMSGMLKELGCPYTQFITGPLTSRLQTMESRMLLLDYLLTELMAMKMCLKLKPQENSYIIPMFESSTAQALQNITNDLNLSKPPDNISAKNLLEKISNRLDETIKKTNPKKLSEPLYKETVALTDDQWKKLSLLQKELDQEYNLRRQMLLTRLEVTIQSFQWSTKMKGREEDIIKRYQSKKQILDQLQYGDIGTDIAALLAARQDLAVTEKTSNANVRKNTATKIQKHVIGKVPDRGGRAYEHAPPPPEMPSWQQNRAGPGAGRGGGNRGGGGRGGGGNWKQQQSSQYQGNSGGGGGFNQRQSFDQSGGGFNHRQNFDQSGGGFNQRQNFEQRGQFDQRPQHEMRDNQNFAGGNNRVQGGWSQRGNDRNSFNQRGESGNFGGGDNSYRGNNPYNTQGGNFGGQNNFGGSGCGNNYGNGSQGHSRGRASYNRGGGGGGGNWR